jgi:hypothetical protein
MSLPQIEQLRFTRSEWQRGLSGLSELDAMLRLEPMNSISWMVGHLAWHERLLWMERGQGLRVEPELDAFASDQPASTPSLPEMQAAWNRIVAAADAFLEPLRTADLERRLPHDSRPDGPNGGTALLYITYHYWSHIGEASAIRQMLGHTALPEFVGDMPSEAFFRREPD